MQIQVRGTHMDIGESFQQYIEEQVLNTCEKFFNHAVNAQIAVQPDVHSQFKTDIMLSVGNGIVMRASASAGEPYPSFDQALDKIGRQLRKYKDRLRDHHQRMQDAEDSRMAASQYVIEAVSEEEETAEHKDSSEPVIIAETQTNIEVLSVSEAVMRMDLEDLPALMFRNRSHDGLNMIYKRPDGNIGWVDPRGNNQA